jgi:hypothetical protein
MSKFTAEKDFSKKLVELNGLVPPVMPEASIKNLAVNILIT